MSTEEYSANVSLDIPLEFYWVDNPSLNPADHIDEAVDRLFDAISEPGVRLWSPESAILMKRNFRKRIENATAGKLKPRSEFKPVGDGRLPIFEIIWSGLAVRERGIDGSPDQYKDVEVRLLHGEPLALGLCAVGLHCHEKFIAGTQAEVHAAQDEEIGRAQAIYREAEPRLWGVTRREVVGTPTPPV